jgi:hypothetical protein
MSPSSKSKGRSGVQITVSFSDSIRLIKDQVHWTPKGVRLLSKWHFAEGTEVEFAFDHEGERHCCSGVVVTCHPLREPSGFYEMILFFIETPCTKLQKAACDCRLAAEGVPKDEIHFTTTNQALAGAEGAAVFREGRDEAARPASGSR